MKKREWSNVGTLLLTRSSVTYPYDPMESWLVVILALLVSSLEVPSNLTTYQAVYYSAIVHWIGCINAINCKFNK